MEEQVVPLQPMKDHSGADMHTAAHGGPYAGAGGYALMEAAAHGDPTPEQAPGRSCCLRGVPVGRSPCRSRFSGSNCSLWQIRAGAVFPEGL